MVCRRCFITQEFLRHCGSDRHAEVGPALVKVTDLFRWSFLGQPPHQPSNYFRACSLACHLNQEATLLKRACQGLPIASPLPHLEQDVLYTILR